MTRTVNEQGKILKLLNILPVSSYLGLVTIGFLISDRITFLYLGLVVDDGECTWLDTDLKFYLIRAMPKLPHAVY